MGNTLSFDNLAGADTGCAGPNPGVTAVDHSTHQMQVDIPTPLADIVGVADLIPKTRSFAADFTNFRHY